MTIRTGIFAIIIAILIGIGGWYVFMHTQSLPRVLTQTGDRQIKEDTDYYSIQVVYPNTTRLGTRTDSSKQADMRAVASIEAAMNDMVATFKDEANKALTTDEKARLKEQGVKYAFSVASHEYNSGSFVSYEFDIYQDTGGAHPINFYKTLVYDLKGNQVSLDSLFTSGSNYLERIAVPAKVQISAQLADRDGADATTTLVSDGVAPTKDNFSNWVDDQGILTFFIPPYQAASYAAGSFEVRVPLQDLKDIVKLNVQ